MHIEKIQYTRSENQDEKYHNEETGYDNIQMNLYIISAIKYMNPTAYKKWIKSNVHIYQTLIKRKVCPQKCLLYDRKTDVWKCTFRSKSGSKKRVFFIYRITVYCHNSSQLSVCIECTLADSQRMVNS